MTLRHADRRRVPLDQGDGSQTRSFQYVDDLVRGLIALMNSDYDGPVNIGNPDEYTVKDFAKVRPPPWCRFRALSPTAHAVSRKESVAEFQVRQLLSSM